MATLGEHIQHSGNFQAYRGVKAQYQKLYAQYTDILYDAAKKYLRDVLRERFDSKKLPPVTAWQTEREKLTAERSKLYRKYISLRNESTEADQIRRGVDDFSVRKTAGSNPTGRRVWSYDFTERGRRNPSPLPPEIAYTTVWKLFFCILI